MKSIDIGRERLLMAFWKYQRVKASNNNRMNQHLWETESKEASKTIKQQLKYKKAALNENFICVYMCLCVYVYLYVSMCVQNSDYRH